MEIIIKTNIDNEELKENFMDIVYTFYEIDDKQEQFLEEKFSDILYEISIKVQNLVLDRFENQVNKFISEIFEEVSIHFINNLAKEMNLEKKEK